MNDIPVEPDERSTSTSAAVEQEVTKRKMIESVTTVLLVVLYMIFSLVRTREPGVIALDDAKDDWKA